MATTVEQLAAEMSADNQDENVSVKMLGDMDSSLKIAVQDTNGENVFNNERALIGFMEANKYLMLPSVFMDEAKAAKWDPVDLKVFGKADGPSTHLGKDGETYRKTHPYLRVEDGTKDEASRMLTFLKILAMNYHTLVIAGLNVQEAFIAAALRGRFCLIGAYHITANDKMSQYVEVVRVDNNNTDTALADINKATTVEDVLKALGSDKILLLTAMAKEGAGIIWVNAHADNIWAANEYAFRIRSHHYKTGGKDDGSYEKLYTRFLNACFEGNFKFPEGVNLLHIFHTATHPFKIKALPVIAAHMSRHGLLANSAMLRLSGAPCGHAVITTTYAALDTMRSEVWWSAFEHCYHDSIRILGLGTDYIMDNKYQCHISHSLYGLDYAGNVKIDGEFVTLDKVKSLTEAIAAAGQGMINALKEAKKEGLITDFALSNAKALEKPGSANPMLTVKVSALVLKAIDSINDDMTLSDALKIAFPVLTHDSRKPSGSVTDVALTK